MLTNRYTYTMTILAYFFQVSGATLDGKPDARREALCQADKQHERLLLASFPSITG